MKSEIAFFRDKRYRPTAENLIRLYKFLGYTDAQIIQEMKNIKAKREIDKQNKSTESDKK